MVGGEGDVLARDHGGNHCSSPAMEWETKARYLCGPDFLACHGNPLATSAYGMLRLCFFGVHPMRLPKVISGLMTDQDYLSK